MWLKLFILSTALFCMACGNADMGAQAKLKAKAAGSSSSAQSIALAAQAALQQLTCKAFSVAAAGDPYFGQLFSGSSVCYAAANPALTTVKVTSFSAGSHYCLIPIRGEIPQTETCFVTNTYSTSVSLQSADYTALVLVPDVYLAAYKMYLNGQTTSAPPLAVSVLAL